MTLTQRFLRAKHWQLFILTFGLPILFQIIFMVLMMSDVDSDGSVDSSSFNYFMYPFIAVLLICAVTYYGWLWSIATGLQRIIPENVKMKVRKFKVFFFIPLIYIIFFFTGLGFFMDEIGGPTRADKVVNADKISSLMVFILPVHLFSMFCILYTLYFVAKSFKTAELQRQTTFSEFVGEFFMVWFYPIGIWILQPKINQLVDRPPTDGITY
ncbi:hypothetical protein [Pollutibacter soli]|uniref:hypothetical protein n=1 Tax=Pollutibacter soli TaxID=3034157 RepID=UPI003013BF63